VVLRSFSRTPLPTPQKPRGIFFLKKGNYRQAVYVTKEQWLSLLAIFYARKNGSMLISEYQSRTGKENVIVDEEKGWREPEIP